MRRLVQSLFGLFLLLASSIALEAQTNEHLISIWDNAKDWKRFRNKSDELAKPEKYEAAALDGRRMSLPARNAKDTRDEYFINVYTFDKDFAAALYLTNISAYFYDKPLEICVLFNDKPVKTLSLTELPQNLKIADKAKASDRLSVAVRNKNGEALSNVISFALEAYKDGSEPGKAVETLHPAATEPSPKRSYAGPVNPDYKVRHEGQQNEIKKKKSRVIFAGDSITDGFNGAGKKSWEALARFNPGNMGISGDWNQNLLWRFENSVLDEVKPELVVVLIGTNNGAYSEDEVVAGIKANLDMIKKKSPSSKILLLGIFPRDNEFPKGNRLDRINEKISKFADSKTVFFMDIADTFITPDRKVRKDLLPDGLHPGDKGYEAWIAAIMPMLDDLLPAK